MSSPVIPHTAKEPNTVSADNDNSEEHFGDLEIYNAAKQPSTSSLISSINSEEIKLPDHILPRKLKCSSKRFNKYHHHSYKMQSLKCRGKDVQHEKVIKSSSVIEEFYENLESLQKPPETSIEDSIYNEILEVGNVDSQDLFVCSLYITSYNSFEDQFKIDVGFEQCANTLNSIASGKVKIQRTCCGMMAAFTKEDDADRFIKLPLRKIFESPMQVAKFTTGEFKFRQNVIVKDVPWCISNMEIHAALKLQGVSSGKIVRLKGNLKVEVVRALGVHQLLQEGLNFFGYASFPVVLESSTNQGEPDIVQCFKCQGFWHTSTHCRQMPRCVRCGNNHDVEYCPRPRNAPICCHCGGPHHAAYKMCPVRLQHINSTYVGFQLARTKPAGPFGHNVF